MTKKKVYQVNISLRDGKKLEHNGIKVEFIGSIGKEKKNERKFKFISLYIGVY